MKYYISVLFLFISVIFTIQNISAETIRMGFFNLPPHMYAAKESDKSQGLSIAYFEMVASQMGHKVEWVGPLPLPRLNNYLAHGEEGLDGSIHFPKQDFLEIFLYYPDNEYYSMHPVFIIKKEHPLIQINSIDDVRGYRVGMHDVPLPTAFIANNRDQLHLEPIPGEEWACQNLKKLLANRIDAIYDLNQYTILFEAIKLGLHLQIKILPLPDPPEKTYVVFAKTSDKGKRLLEQYNAVIKKSSIDYHILAEKEIDSITQKR